MRHKSETIQKVWQQKAAEVAFSVDENFFTNLKTSIILVHTASNSDSAEKSALCNSTVEVLSTEISNHVIRSESFCASL